MTTAADWEARAAELRERGGVPRRQAEVVALIEAGLTHREVKEELGLETRSEVSTHVARYRDNHDAAKWLVEHGADI